MSEQNIEELAMEWCEAVGLSFADLGADVVAILQAAHAHGKAAGAEETRQSLADAIIDRRGLTAADTEKAKATAAEVLAEPVGLTEAQIAETEAWIGRVDDAHPLLFSRREKLRALVAECRRLRADSEKTCHGCALERQHADQLRAENERLREALTKIIREDEAEYNHRSLVADIARRALAERERK